MTLTNLVRGVAAPIAAKEKVIYMEENKTENIDTGNATDFYGATFLKPETVKKLGLEGLQTIEKVSPQIINVEGKPEQKKLGVYFKGFEEFQLILNKTNSKTLTDAYGNKYHGWENKQVKIVIKEIEVSGKTMDAIRLEIPKTE